jgi:hypothetical protein
MIDWLIIYGITSRSRIFHLYGDVTIVGEGLQNLGLCLALSGPLSREGSLSCHTFCDTGPRGFSGLIRRTAPFNRLLQHTWGCGGSILTRILTGIFHQSINLEYCKHFNHFTVCCYRLLSPGAIRNWFFLNIFILYRWKISRGGIFSQYSRSQKNPHIQETINNYLLNLIMYMWFFRESNLRI